MRESTVDAARSGGLAGCAGFHRHQWNLAHHPGSGPLGTACRRHYRRVLGCNAISRGNRAEESETLTTEQVNGAVGRWSKVAWYPRRDLPANQLRANRLSRSRSDRPPKGVDQRERGALIARGVGGATSQSRCPARCLAPESPAVSQVEAFAGDRQGSSVPLHTPTGSTGRAARGQGRSPRRSLHARAGSLRSPGRRDPRRGPSSGPPASLPAP
jgi:hypothetical protein